MRISTIALAAFLRHRQFIRIRSDNATRLIEALHAQLRHLRKGHGPSGSGSSTSGGRDDSGDEGRDKMPEANAKVRPAPGKPDIPNAANQK
jgi:hypothetical protein